MFYTIYKTTNLINNKFYIGKHQTTNLDDGYLGSGKLLNHAIKKYGVENFVKEILHIFDNEKDMNHAEKDLVVLSEQSYNLVEGGQGGFGYINRNRLNGFCNKEVARKGRQITNKILEEKYGNNWKFIIAEKASHAGTKAYKEKFETDPEFREKISSSSKKASTAALGATSREKRKQTFTENQHQQGCKNSNFGKIWISNISLKESKTLLKTDIIPDGWVKGRLFIKKNIY